MGAIDWHDFYRVFRVGTPFNKKWHNNPFLAGSLQAQVDLPSSKKRKEFLNPFFSKAQISRVEPYLHRAKLIKFINALEDASKDNGKAVDLYLGFRCLTADTIMDYCFQQDFDALSEKNFQSKTVQAMVEAFELALLPTYFPNFFEVLNKIIFSLPEKVREEKFAAIYGFQTMQKVRS